MPNHHRRSNHQPSARGKSKTMRWALATALAGLQLASAQAVEADLDLHLPAQPLAAALEAYSRATGLQLIFRPESVAGLSSPALDGRYSRADALRHLLTGTALNVQTVDDHTLAIKPSQQNPDNIEKPDAAATLPAVKVVGQAAYDATDPYNPDYALPNASSGTKTDTPIMETPLNVQVISKQVLKDQQVIRLDQALKNISGVSVANGNNNSAGPSNAEQYTLRGFATSTLFRNGFRMDAGSTWYGNGQQMANVESVEVLKGPAAILFGRVEPGGMINVITKKPRATPYYAINQQFGSYDLFRTSVDATGAINSDASLLYRVNASFQSNHSYRDLVESDDKFIAPVIQWQIGAKTQATLEMEYQHKRASEDFMILPTDGNNRFIDLPHQRNLGEKNLATTDGYFAGFNWTHQFNEDWSIKHQVNFRRREVRQGPSTLPIFLAGNTLSRVVYGINPETNDTLANILDLTGHFTTGALKHTLLVGGDHYATDYFQDLTFGGIGFTLSDIDINGPAHPGPGLVLDPSLRQLFAQKTDNFGAYLQDQIELPHNIHLLGGFRYQYVHSKIFRGGADGVLRPDAFGLPQTDDDVTPRVAVLWQPAEWLSVYGNYVENFGANTGRFSFVEGAAFGKALAPETAQQWELGAKSELFDGRLRLSLAYYDLTKQNVATLDVARGAACGNNFCYLSVGEVNSSGPELDIQGEILPGWNAILTYAHQDVRVTKSSDTSGQIKVGNRLQFVPENTASAWSTYEIQQGPAKGLKFGGGVTLRDYVVNANNQTRSVGNTLVGLMTGYSFKVGKSKVTAQLNVDNLLDQRYFTDASPVTDSGYGYVSFSNPRSFIGSVNVEY
ncbi:TonB-dependent receptor [Methylomonas sp. UP202]|uniref:TonB-dependent siderophore receptor n=1 Tax=Methylomonas sp. UP202 TaxID=3040943 RepID=UPI00247A8D0C|nr:TonB-dependent receptor [Methylomonas sp. UP202]WGS85388.1 TonB-dependent receptor [Methylomonas sp. UP202]